MLDALLGYVPQEDWVAICLVAAFAIGFLTGAATVTAWTIIRKLERANAQG
jgi:hypothetical protein